MAYFGGFNLYEKVYFVQGVTQVKHEKSPFKKNAAFSTPISESKDPAKPGEDWNY